MIAYWNLHGVCAGSTAVQPPALLPRLDFTQKQSDLPFAQTRSGPYILTLHLPQMIALGELVGSSVSCLEESRERPDDPPDR